MAFTLSNFSQEYTPSLQLLRKIGKFLVDQIAREAKLDAVKRKSLAGKETLPQDRDFYESFTYQVVNGEIRVTSDWPGLDRHLEGRDPYEMKWLRSETGNPKPIPMIDNTTGRLVFRMAPFQGTDVWIHPGVMKSSFYERALRKTMDQAKKWIAEEYLSQLKKG